LANSSLDMKKLEKLAVEKNSSIHRLQVERCTTKDHN
jgi:hypothetical protein